MLAEAVSMHSLAIASAGVKDVRATSRCFDLIGAHQCGILMVDA